MELPKETQNEPQSGSRQAAETQQGDNEDNKSENKESVDIRTRSIYGNEYRVPALLQPGNPSNRTAAVKDLVRKALAVAINAADIYSLFMNKNRNVLPTLQRRELSDVEHVLKLMSYVSSGVLRSLLIIE